MVSRIYVEKKPGFDVEAKQLLAELANVVSEGLAPDARLRIINRYDVEGLSDELFERCVPVVFSEPQVDATYRELPANPDAADVSSWAVDAMRWAVAEGVISGTDRDGARWLDPQTTCSRAVTAAILMNWLQG